MFFLFFHDNKRYHELIDLNLQAIYIPDLWNNEVDDYNKMEDYELINLELQIESLIQSREKLRHENISLRQKLIKLTQERAELVDKNKRAASKIKRIISQLRHEMQ